MLVRMHVSNRAAPLDIGPFYHGSNIELAPGEHFTAGFHSNYRPDVVMNHIYFTALRDGAGLAAEVAALRGGQPHVYQVVPTGEYENDPNVTDKKFPGNPTRSYRSSEPLTVIREVTDWTRLTPDALESWRQRLADLVDSGAEIIN
jgi:rifampin ADP-ribosylating transferase